MLKEVFAGIRDRIILENTLQLQKNKLTRPRVIKLEIASTYKQIDDQLKDPELKKIYDSIELKLPE